MEIQNVRGEEMPAESVGSVGGLLANIEKYGVVTVLFILLILFLWYIIKQIMSGNLVVMPRWQYDKQQENTDKLMKVLEDQETGALQEIRDFIKRIKTKEDADENNELKALLEYVQKAKAKEDGGG
ncbi:hypothetical protein D3C76_934360 [compost metagenome]